MDASRSLQSVPHDGLDFRISSGVLAGDAYVVSVGGEVDLFTAPRLDERLVELADAGARRVVVDLAGASFIDSTVLGVLLKALARFEHEGGALAIVTDDRRILRVFEITGLNRVFRLMPSLTDAVEAMVAVPGEHV